MVSLLRRRLSKNHLGRRIIVNTTVFVCGFCLCSTTVADRIKCEDPYAKKSYTRVAGGTIANPEDFQWQVALQSTRSGFCGGSLIGRRWVLTAAHCVIKEISPNGDILPGYTIKVVRSDAIGKLQSDFRNAMKVFIPDGYDINKNNQLHDIALVVLEEGFEVPPEYLLKFADRKISPLFLKPGVCAVVTGWGALGENRHPTERLHKAYVPIRHGQECRSAYPSVEILPSHICAGYTLGGADSCQGDSGGALAIRGGPHGWLQIGIVSWGKGCGRQGKYGVYTRVDLYAEWILNIVRNYPSSKD